MTLWTTVGFLLIAAVQTAATGVPMYTKLINLDKQFHFRGCRPSFVDQD
jgi:hypothetical protein